MLTHQWVMQLKQIKQIESQIKFPSNCINQLMHFLLQENIKLFFYKKAAKKQQTVNQNDKCETYLQRTNFQQLLAKESQCQIRLFNYLQLYILQLLNKQNIIREDQMLETRNKKNPIAGYMGYVPSNEQKEGNYSNQIPQSHIPGYVGYIPSVKAENLYGKTYGRITQDCVRGNFQKGIELPIDIKYRSTTKQTYDNPNKVKDQQLNEGKMNGVKLSTFSNAAKLLMDASNGFKSKEYTQQTVTKLTYEQACRKAYQ